MLRFITYNSNFLTWTIKNFFANLPFLGFRERALKLNYKHNGDLDWVVIWVKIRWRRNINTWGDSSEFTFFRQQHLKEALVVLNRLNVNGGFLKSMRNLVGVGVGHGRGEWSTSIISSTIIIFNKNQHQIYVFSWIRI